MVSRERLLERLRSGSGLRLSLVACPAGFGKTTLLAAWREAEATRRPVAWLTVDEGDDDPVVFWSHAIEPLRRVCPKIGEQVSAEIAGAAPIVEVVLPHLVNELAEQGAVTLILDDFHRLSGRAARDSVAWFVDHAPRTFQLVLSTRTEPALRLAALRAHGELLELRAGDLRFTAEEAGAFLNGHLGLGLAPEDVDDLVDRTQGWPAGIYLAALSLTRTTDRHALVRSFGVSSRPVVDFLVTEVLEAHDPPVQELMLRCSILERLCGPLCDAVLEQQDSRAILGALSRTNLLEEVGMRGPDLGVFARQDLRAETASGHPKAGPGLLGAAILALWTRLSDGAWWRAGSSRARRHARTYWPRPSRSVRSTL